MKQNSNVCHLKISGKLQLFAIELKSCWYCVVVFSLNKNGSMLTYGIFNQLCYPPLVLSNESNIYSLKFCSTQKWAQRWWWISSDNDLSYVNIPGDMGLSVLKFNLTEIWWSYHFRRKSWQFYIICSNDFVKNAIIVTRLTIIISCSKIYFQSLFR